MSRLIDVEAKDQKDTTPDPLMAMIFFFIVTSIYCVISIFIVDSSQKSIARVCYIIFVIIGEYFINLTLSQQMCGKAQWKNTMFITLVPWITIFGVLHVILIMFPGWSVPFSNTFGYLVAKLMGLPEFMKKILVDQNADLPEASRALESIRSDNSLFMNELHPEARKEKLDPKTQQPLRPSEYERPKFDAAWKKLEDSNIIKKFDEKTSERPKMMKELYSFVNMKYSISEYVWNLLTGFLVTSISYNYILNTGCAKSPTEMKNRYDKYEAEQNAKRANKDKKKENEPTYTQM
jgi:hypothetical protein